MSAEATETEEYGDNDGSAEGVYAGLHQRSDLSAVSNTIPAAQRVGFTIVSIKPDVFAPNGVNVIEKLKVTLKIGADGAGEGEDGQPLYVGKNQFAELVTYVDADAYPKWAANSPELDYKRFMIAMGYDAKQLPEINAELVAELTGQDIVADITRTPQKRKVDGKYINRRTVLLLIQHIIPGKPVAAISRDPRRDRLSKRGVNIFRLR